MVNSTYTIFKRNSLTNSKKGGSFALDSQRIGAVKDLLCLAVQPLDVVAQGSDLRLENVMLLDQILGGQ